MKINERSKYKDDSPKSTQHGDIIVEVDKVVIDKKVDIGLVLFLAMWLVLGVGEGDAPIQEALLPGIERVYHESDTRSTATDHPPANSPNMHNRLVP